MRYLAQRLARFLIVFFIVTFGLMILMRLGMNKPGDPARTMLGGTVSQQQIDDVTARYHLDAPIIVQYGYWLKGMLTLDMGVSVQQNLAVSTYIGGRIVVTLLLGLYSLALGVLVAIPAAVFQAYRRDSVRDKMLSIGSFVFVAVPPVVMGVLLILLFVRTLGWFPRTGEKIWPWDDPVEHFHNFALPVLALALPVGAVFSRLLRGDMVRTLQADFITLASAKGVSTRRILWRHALRNSLFSLLTSIGLQLSGIVGGAIVVEQLFAMKGMGTLLVASILSKDLFVVQALSAIIVTVVVTVLGQPAIQTLLPSYAANVLGAGPDVYGLMLTALGKALFVSPLKWVVILAPLAMVFVLSFGIERVRPATAQILFWIFAALIGLSLGSIFMVYTHTSITRVFFITAASFGALSLYGYTTQRDLTGMASFLIMGLFGIIIASVVNIFLKAEMLQFIISIVGVLVFAGLTAYDTQRLKSEYLYGAMEGDGYERSAILGALSLYLNFINLFTLLLQLLGQRDE